MSILDILGGGDSSSQDYLKKALQAYQQVNVPTPESEAVANLPQETVQGTVTPEQIQAVDQQGSDYNNISLDPSSRQAQINALQQYQDIVNSGGLDAESKLSLQQAIDAAKEQSQGAQGAIQQQARATGNGGGDFALTQKAIAAQGASNNAATQGLQSAAMAEANRQQALASMASLGGSIDSQDYNQAAAKASANDTVNATNAGYKNAANTTNAANSLTAQQFNVGNAQGVNANNTAANQNKVYYNANLPQQQFNNEIAKAGGMAGVNAQQANAAQNASNNQAGFTGKLLGTVGTVGATALGGPVAGAVANSALAAKAPKSNDASAGFNAADGAYVPCFAKGGVPHDHNLCASISRYDMSSGALVGGTPEVEGRSEQNDNVPANLSPGELVIPVDVPKTGPAMEAFAKQAPVAGTNKKVDLTSFTNGYKKGR